MEAMNATEQIEPPKDCLRLSPLAALLADWQTEAEAARAAYESGTPRGPITALPHLDRHLGGFLCPGLHVVHGAPGTGKTALALQIAASCGAPALFVSCEMRPLELMRRVTARVTQTYLGRLKTGEIPAGVSLDLARQAAASAPQLVLADATRGYAPPDAILQAAEATRGKAGALLIVMDSVHSWVDGCEIDATEYEKLNAGLMQLRALAHKLDCAVLAIAERNRASMKTGGMSAGAGTRKIEYGAETVLDLSVPEDALENASGEKAVKLRFSKNRNGAAGSSVDLAFHGALQRFTEQ